MSKSTSQQMTIGDFLVRRLKEAGVRHLFSVPGDYSLELFAAAPGHWRAEMGRHMCRWVLRADCGLPRRGRSGNAGRRLPEWDNATG